MFGFGSSENKISVSQALPLFLTFPCQRRPAATVVGVRLSTVIRQRLTVKGCPLAISYHPGRHRCPSIRRRSLVVGTRVVVSRERRVQRTVPGAPHLLSTSSPRHWRTVYSRHITGRRWTAGRHVVSSRADGGRLVVSSRADGGRPVVTSQADGGRPVVSSRADGGRLVVTSRHVTSRHVTGEEHQEKPGRPRAGAVR